MSGASVLSRKVRFFTVLVHLLSDRVSPDKIAELLSIKGMEEGKNNAH